MGTKAQTRRAAKDRVIEAARELVDDRVDAEANKRGIDVTKFDALSDAVAEFDRKLTKKQ